MNRKNNGMMVCIISAAAMLLLWACHQEEPAAKPKIESIQFAEAQKEMAVGERVTVGVTALPAKARSSAKIVYSASIPGIIAIDEEHSSNEGVVFEAVAPGSVVLLAKTGKLVDYCSITVTGDYEVTIPYIVLTDSVLEIAVGKKKHVAASLSGGSPADQNNFGFSNSDDHAVYMESANNTAIFEGLRAGSSRVTVTHPKAQYSVDVVAFVLNEGETARYISGENVVFMELGGSTREYAARLVGVDESNYNNTIYQVVEGTDIVEVKGVGASCTLAAKAAGVAKVKVTNQAVEYPFEFQVVVRHTGAVKYITSNSSFYIINHDDFVNFNVGMEGDAPSDYIEKFSYSLSDKGREILEVEQLKSHFIVRGLGNGNAVLTINNAYSDFPCEILFVVQNQKISATGDILYIKTSQNVIQMEAGKNAPDAILKMELVGGTSADQNKFEWVVEDSSIIDVKAPGTVRYTRAQIDAYNSFEAEAVITAKKAGTTRITVYNSRALNDVTVMVKVYPYGTFNGQAIYLGGPSIIKMQEGEARDIYTPVIGGNISMLGATKWESAHPAIAEADGSGLHGVVSGMTGGVTRLIVSGENIAQDFESVVVVYREGEKDTIPYIYTDNLHYHITVGQTVRIKIYHPNIEDNDFFNNFFTVNNTNKDSIYYVLSGDVIIASGFSEGSGELVITTADSRCNDLNVHITVESDKLDIDRPYTLAGDNFAGTDEGGVVSYTVKMTGASLAELKNLVWSVDDEKVARIMGVSGDTVQIKGLASGQTNLRINHSKSANEKTVIVYVVKSGESIEGKIIIGIEKANHVLLVNQSVFLRLLTNAGEQDKALFKYKTVNGENIHLDFNYDTMVVTALKEGNSKITIMCYETAETDKKNLVDLDIFITVKSDLGIRAEIGFPDSVVLVKNKFKVVKGNAVGIEAGYLNDIQYEFEDSAIASVTGNGLEATIKGLQSGQTFMAVTCAQLSFFKKVLVICVETEDDLNNLYYCTVPQTLYRIKKGDEIRVNLGFGENGAPPSGVYEWRNTNNNEAVIISPQGSQGSGALIIGRNEGQAVIQITCAATPNNKPVEIIVEVSENVKGSDYYRFGFTAGIRQMSKGGVEMLPVSIYYGNEFYDDYDVLKPGIKLEQGYSGITVTVSDETVLQAAMAGENGQSLRISAEKAGRAEIILSHNMIAEDAKLLVVVYDGAVPPAGSDFIFYVPQKHFLIDKGETKNITVQTNTDAQTAQGALLWINNNPDLFTLDSSNRVNAQVTALKEGSGTLTVQDAFGAVETVYVSVSAGLTGAHVSVATESIIVLSLEDAQAGGYTTRIIVSGGNQNGIIWESGDYDLLGINGGNTSCTLYPKKCGITNLTVSGYGFAKTIIVKIVDREEDKQQVRLMNLDQRSYRIKKGETVILNPYYKIAKPISPALVTPEYDNNVVQWQPSGSGIAVTAKNIGIEHLVLSNSECENQVAVVFEVDETVSGSVGEIKNVVYMTTDNPVIILRPEYNDYYTFVKVIGEYAGADGDFIWSCDSPLITLNSFGRSAVISTGSKEGQAVVTVHNDWCAEPLLKINVVIRNSYTQQANNDPYMYTERTIYTMNRNDSSLLIPLTICNLGSVDYNLVQLTPSGSAIECTFANGNIIVNARDAGTGIIDVRYAGLTLKLYVIVQESGENGAVYLTTVHNYVIVNVNNTQAINVDLVNYMEPDSTKITWTSDNTNVAHVIGSGKVVQVLGIGAGVTKITASHGKSFNKLDIIVKVLPEGSSENICYLTTNENVIETYVSTNSRQIMVSKIGGKIQSVDASWTVDRPEIVGVMGANDMAYITAKKAGQARITVSDKEAGTLEIVVIVRETKPGDLFIIPNENIVQITPGSSNYVISVSMAGIDESDEKNFKWEIFSQLPSDINVARNGGNVVGIYSMGARATLNGVYAGTARIKVTHPKAAEAAYIVAQVTNFQSLRFGQAGVDIVKNDMAYVVVQTPDYENYTDKIRFRVDNPGVATVVGTHRVALVSARDVVGKATITAYIPNTDLTATLTVNVKEEKTYNEPQIITNQTMFILGPREAPFYASASLIGFGIVEDDNDLLEWEINYLEDKKDDPMLKIYPENIKGDEGFKSRGKTVLFEVQTSNNSKLYETIKYCTVTISHPRTSHKRVLYFQVQDDSNAFTISSKYIQLETGQTAELSCNILNGTSRDYDEVVWEARRDDIDPGKDIVKIMGRGKTVQLMGISDGSTIVTASYRGLNTQGTRCAVVVKSVYYFNITYQNLMVYPGQKDDKGGVFQVKYSVRPPNAPIQWMNTDTDINKQIAVVSYGAAEDDGTGTGQGSIYFSFLQEGNFSILGISNKKVSKVDITVKNVFELTVNHRNLIEPPYKYHNPKNVTNFKDGINNDGTRVIDVGYLVTYTVIPATAYIQITETGIGTEVKNVKNLFSEGWDVQILRPEPNGMIGIGKIYIKNNIEQPEPAKSRYFTFSLYKSDGTLVVGEEYQKTLNFASKLPPGQGRLVPVFERVSGFRSNYYGKYSTSKRYQDGSTPVGHYPKVEKSTVMGGEYLANVSNYTNKTFERKDTFEEDRPIEDYYSLNIADGEEHYIILDKFNPDALIELHNNAGDILINDFILDGNGRGMTAQVVRLDNGLYAIKISGGKDFVRYNRFGTTYELTCKVVDPGDDDKTIDGIFKEYPGDNKTLHADIDQLMNPSTNLVRYKDGLGYRFTLYNRYDITGVAGTFLKYELKSSNGKVTYEKNSWSDTIYYHPNPPDNVASKYVIMDVGYPMITVSPWTTDLLKQFEKGPGDGNDDDIRIYDAINDVWSTVSVIGFFNQGLASAFRYVGYGGKTGGTIDHLYWNSRDNNHEDTYTSFHYFICNQNLPEVEHCESAVKLFNGTDYIEKSAWLQHPKKYRAPTGTIANNPSEEYYTIKGNLQNQYKYIIPTMYLRDKVLGEGDGNFNTYIKNANNQYIQAPNTTFLVNTNCKYYILRQHADYGHINSSTWVIGSTTATEFKDASTPYIKVVKYIQDNNLYYYFTDQNNSNTIQIIKTDGSAYGRFNTPIITGDGTNNITFKNHVKGKIQTWNGENPLVVKPDELEDFDGIYVDNDVGNVNPLQKVKIEKGVYNSTGSPKTKSLDDLLNASFATKLKSGYYVPYFYINEEKDGNNYIYYPIAMAKQPDNNPSSALVKTYTIPLKIYYTSSQSSSNCIIINISYNIYGDVALDDPGAKTWDNVKQLDVEYPDTTVKKEREFIDYDKLGSYEKNINKVWTNRDY